jgi:hypothetical protein
MTKLSGLWVLMFVGYSWLGLARPQDTVSADQPSGAYAPGISKNAAAPSESVADIARRMRSKKPAEVKMSDEDAKELFKSVDTIFEFASEDTGFPRRAVVKRRMIGQSDLEKSTRERLAKPEFAQRFERAELVMKKIGLLPRDFNLREFVVKANPQQIAAYYDDTTKTISMMNWISLERQRPILAHELTHALQDQSYDLKKWALAGEPRQPTAKKGEEVEPGESTLARHAVVEGQAQIVYIDYLLARFGRSLKDTPGVLSQMEEPAVSAAIDTELLHSAPYVLRETGTFPYREGLIFEGELLQKGGKQMAFAGAFARPPQNTHEVLQPKAYLEHEKLRPVSIPELGQLLAGNYKPYDSGTMGELDVRALLKQYDERKAAPELAAAWQGGAYAAFQKTGAAEGSTPTTADLAFIYVSRWKSADAATQFARFYAATPSKRYRTATPLPLPACSGNSCPVAAGQFATDEGPVIVEQWPDNTVIISESFDSTTAAKLVSAVREASTDTHAQLIPQDELSLRLYELPAFRDFQANIQLRIAEELWKEAAQR